MIEIDTFIEAVRAETGIDLSITNVDNEKQREVATSAVNESLFVVAGPGSGKTTSSTLRILKLIFVDGLAPDQILATTFTRKAATALRSKLVNFGESLRERFRASAHDQLGSKLDRIDLNGIRLGTLDSIAQDVLTEFRLAAAPAPRPIEEFARSSVFVVNGVLANGLHNSNNAIPALWRLLYGNNQCGGVGARAKMLKDLHERCANDRVDIKALAAAYPDTSDPLHRGLQAALAAISEVQKRYSEEHVCDFAGLAEKFLDVLDSGDLEAFTSNLRFILVDEYQDTNLLQESIYFGLARAAVRAPGGGSICVVGDDDQSIYRFRGATVDLFQNFEKRLNNKVGIAPKRIELVNNYRSTKTIVDFVNSFVELDPEYANGRVQPPKPRIVPMRKDATSYPVIGIFRPDRAALARDLARFIGDVVNGPGITVPYDGTTFAVRVDPVHGSPNDVALLMSSVNETMTTGRPRLPLLLRNELANLSQPLKVFNPRGQDLADQPGIAVLLGLALLCLDASGSITATVPMSGPARQVFASWRNVAQARLDTNPDLSNFVQSWACRLPTRQGRPDRIAAERISLNELLYKLIAWLPEIQYDIEQLALLEAVTRAVVAASIFGPFDSEIIFGSSPSVGLPAASVKSCFQTVLVPIAEGAIDVNEDLLDTLPRDRISILTVHQAKGLEFPITIVDVGSDGENLKSFRAFKRYPDDPAPAHRFEDVLRAFSELGSPSRSGLNRAFDDLVRQSFVAYSRPQDVLVLVGVNRCVQSARAIQNVATGWVRPSSGGTCAWPGLSDIAQWSAP